VFDTSDALQSVAKAPCRSGRQAPPTVALKGLRSGTRGSRPP
jgi:hypothetical protein